MDRTRRQFIRYFGAGVAGATVAACGGGGGGATETAAGSSSTTAAASPTSLAAAATVPTGTGAKGRVIVVGGGMAGATVAKYLRLWGGADVQVTLIERSAQYQSCILSNLVLTGARDLSRLTYTWTTLVKNYGINLVADEVTAIDAVGKTVRTAGGRSLAYDRLVLAPGVDFDTLPGLESAGAQASHVHAWKAGPQTNTLRDQIRAMANGGVFVMTIPAAPFRCPPGPYERACVVADWLKKNRPGSKVIVLDANPGIVAEKGAFTQAFDVTHKGVIEYHPSVSIAAIDPATRVLSTTIGDIRASVINPIPPHRAGKVARDAGLVNVNDRWVGVDVLSYESTAARGIHVIGDACGTTQPKSGHIANAEAKVCADAIVRTLRGEALDPAPSTNSACYSPITADTASWLSVVFQYDATTRTMKAAGAGVVEADAASKGHYEDMFVWFGNLMGDTFA